MPRSARPLLALFVLWMAAVPAPAGAAPGYGSALPRFALFGWVSPPSESTTVARYTELAAAGFNVTVTAQDEPGTFTENRLRLDVTRRLGLRNLLLDNDLDSVSIAVPASLALADTIVARYKNDPAFLGYYLGDEPPAWYFARLGEWFEILRARDPAHPAWNSLRPRWMFGSAAEFQAYLQQYVAATHPAVLCNNQYDFTTTGDMHYLTENVATLGAVARASGVPFWGIVQLVEHWRYRHVTEGMLRWQIAQWLAGGAHGIGYFTYWTPPSTPDITWQPAMIEWGTGARTPYYDMVTALNVRLASLGGTLAGLTWRATEHAGSVPYGGVPFTPDTVLAAVAGRATLGWFRDTNGLAYLFLANADSLSPRTVTLTLTDGQPPSRLRDGSSKWDRVAVDAGGNVALGLDAGDFVLLRFPARIAVASVGTPSGDATLSLRVAPNPARGVVRFELAGAAGAAQLDVIDLSGRVVWSRALPPGAREATWSGERAGVGRAGNGIYFARLRNAGRSVVRRIAWLGSR